MIVLLIALATGQVETRSTGNRTCTQHVFVQDGQRTIHLIRNGYPPGNWSEWKKDYCPTPQEVRQKYHSYPSKDWPKKIKESEARRLLGERAFQFFSEHKRVISTGWCNLTRQRVYDYSNMAGQHFNLGE